MNRATTRAIVLAVLTSLWAFTCGKPGLGQEPPTGSRQAPSPAPQRLEPNFPATYGPLDASREAYERGERQRRRAIDRQLQTVEDMVWYSGVPGHYRIPPGLDTIYSLVGRYVYGFRRAIRVPDGRPYYPSAGVFEPWPFVPGDIYGYPYLDRVEQPLGHKVIRTGPNGYIYRPVYEWDLKPVEPATPEAATTSAPEAIPPGPVVERPVEPAPEPIPAPPPVYTGPREF